MNQNNTGCPEILELLPFRKDMYRGVVERPLFHKAFRQVSASFTFSTVRNLEYRCLYAPSLGRQHEALIDVLRAYRLHPYLMR